VDGALGYGQTWNRNTAEFEVSLEDVSEDCCNECRNAIADEHHLINLQVRDPKAEMVELTTTFYKNYSVNVCSCLKRFKTGITPATYELKPSNIGVCGGVEVQVDGELGEGRDFNWGTGGTVESVGYQWNVEDGEQCCQKCKEEEPETQMYALSSYGENACYCIKTIPGIIPVTFGRVNYASLCGTN